MADNEPIYKQILFQFDVAGAKLIDIVGRVYERDVSFYGSGSTWPLHICQTETGCSVAGNVYCYHDRRDYWDGSNKDNVLEYAKTLLTRLQHAGDTSGVIHAFVGNRRDVFQVEHGRIV